MSSAMIASTPTMVQMVPEPRMKISSRWVTGASRGPNLEGQPRPWGEGGRGHLGDAP